MANWSDLKNAVASIIKTNGAQEITGQLLQNVLNNIISNVGLNSTFAGIATPETNPGTPDGNVFYLATTAGTYSNFNGIVIKAGEAVILEWKGSWTKNTSGFATQEKLSELGSELKVLSSVDVPSSNLEAVEVVKLNNKLLSNGGEKLFDQNIFCTTDFIDVSDVSYDYYFKPQISVSGFGKIGFYYEDKSVAHCINGYDLSNETNGSTFKLNISLPIKYIRISGNNADSIFIYRAKKRNSLDEFGFVNSVKLNAANQALLSLHKVLDRVDTSSLEKIEVSIQENKLLSSGGEKVFNQNNFCTTDFIDVSDAMYNYYFKPQISVNFSFGKIAFYFEDKSVAYCINGGDLNNETNGSTFKLNIALPIKYIRISGNNVDSIFVYRAKKNILNIGNICYADTNKVLWLGTSIPEGCEYPEKSCEANGYECINNALGQSRLRFTGAPTSVGVGSGRELTAKVDELKAIYQSHVGVEISQSEFNNWLDKSYERSVLPYIKGESLTISDGTTNAINGVINPNKIKVSAVVIDHGYNDYSNVNAIMENQSSIDWESTDRSNFVGAFNYLINEIQKINPFVKIVVGGYFDYTFKSSNKPLGKNLCELQSLIANHYNFELLNVWEYTQISWDRFVEGTASYMTDFNSKYGTSYVVPSYGMDENGNIRSHYLYCPDGVHPHSDKSGNANKRLNAVYTKLLKSIL